MIQNYHHENFRQNYKKTLKVVLQQLQLAPDANNSLFYNVWMSVFGRQMNIALTSILIIIRTVEQCSLEVDGIA